MHRPPTVLIAATTETALKDQIGNLCADRGLHLQVGPSENKLTFDSPEELFATLREMSPSQVAKTMIVLRIGPHYTECFSPRIWSSKSDWHSKRRSGVGIALELVLRFPQVYPVFDSVGGKALSDWIALLTDTTIYSKTMMQNGHSLHFVDTIAAPDALPKLVSRFADGFRTLFDPTGLRTLLRNQFLGRVFGSESDWRNSESARRRLAARLDTLAVVIDEEPEMAMFAAYSAYKFGARAWMVTTFEALKDDANWWHDAAQGLTIVRDLDLRFPDYHDPDPTSKEASLRIRDQLKDIYSPMWQGLLPPTVKIGNADYPQVRVISYDPEVVEKKPTWGPENLRLGQQTNGGTTQYYGLQKPLRSIFAAKSLLGKDAVLEELPVPTAMEKSDHHGAPYENLRISWDLQEQAEECRSDPDVKVCILRALLAQEAYSLLLGMSPTSCLRAIREMVTAEAGAEGESAGVSHTLVIRDRRKELEKTVSNLKLKDKGANFLAKVWAQLRAVYKESEQFEASEEANAESLVYSKWTPARLRISDKVRFTWLKRLVLKPLRSLYSILGLLLTWTLILTVLHAWAYGWTLSLDRPGFRAFFDLYRHILNAIIRPEIMLVHQIDPKEHETLFKAIVDTLMAGSSLIFVGLVVTVLFRKSTRG